MRSLLFSALATLPSAASLTLSYNFPLNTSHPTSFNISVDKALIEEAAIKARLYRPSNDLKDDSNEGGLEGPPRSLMTSIAQYWAEDYDWYQTQEEINNNFSHYALTVPGGPTYKHPIPLHFVHEKSASTEAIPLLLLHGWPSSHLEWSRVIEPLTTPANSTTQAFHVVVPDLPGFGFSPAPEYSGLSPKEMGYAFDKLMHSLGYDKYGVVSTDLGWWIGLWMADIVSDSLVGHFTDFWIQQPSQEDLQRLAENKTTPDETRYIKAISEWTNGHTGYSQIHTQNPLAIGQAMTDSPVGYAGWIWHLTNAVSDGAEYTLREIIDRTMMLWIPGAWNNIRAYREFFNVEAMNFPKTTVPTGVSEAFIKKGPFPGLAAAQLVPRAWIERLVNLVYFRINPSGGHFPAESEPQRWVAEVQGFFGSLV